MTPGCEPDPMSTQPPTGLNLKVVETTSKS